MPAKRLDRRDTVLLLIDLQAKLLPAVADAARVAGAARLLLRAAVALDLPVVISTQHEKGLGPTVPEVAELLPPDAARIDKTAFSCFDADGFAALLERVADGRRTLLVAGIESHICVFGTVRGALGRGWAVEVVADGVSSRGALDAQIGRERMTLAGALPTTAEMAIYELLGRSDGTEFRALLPFLRGRSPDGVA